MGRASRRKRDPATPADGLHARIVEEAAQVRSDPEPGVRNPDDFPALGDLLGSAHAALERSIPARFDHAGRTYWLRVSVGLARLEVFGGPADFEPLAAAMAGSLETFGHRPGH